MCSLSVCPARLFLLGYRSVLLVQFPTTKYLLCVSSMRTGSKHLHSLVNGGALLPVATERRRNAPKRGGAAKVDSRKAGVCRVIRGGICHGCGALRVISLCCIRAVRSPKSDLGPFLAVPLYPHSDGGQNDYLLISKYQPAWRPDGPTSGIIYPANRYPL